MDVIVVVDVYVWKVVSLTIKIVITIVFIYWITVLYRYFF